jgi:glycerol-3-phosphate dehydrogenase (NAD(P)+)
MNDLPIAVLGAGAWGTALAVTLARAGRQVTLGVRRDEQLQALAATRENRSYLPGIEFPPKLALSSDWAALARTAQFIVVAIPSAFVRPLLAPLAPLLSPGTTVVSATKGLDAQTLQTTTQAMAHYLAPTVKLAALSGPGFAAEVARGKPAALVAAATDLAVAEHAQRTLAVRFLRIYRSSDPVGVELGGAIKNVLAVAAGVADGLVLGSSARAAVITRGLAEMIRLATALGARHETLAGLAGLGDLVLTCTGELSRNRALGLAIGAGARPSSVTTAPGAPVVEGAINARLFAQLGRRHAIELPIVTAVCQCLYEDRPPEAIVEELLGRALKAEF